MSEEDDTEPPLPDRVPASRRGQKARRAALNAASAIPFVGGLFAGAAGYWSEREQDAANEFFKHWLSMLEDELREKQITMVEVIARLDLHDEKIKERIRSTEYQSLVRKCFREWSAAESESKRVFVRNILANAAASRVTSDDVVRLFLDWLERFSDMHFEVIGAIYNRNGITRGGIWSEIGRGQVREDSADADLFKLLFRELSVGGIIRQHRPTDYQGNFIKKKPPRRGGSSDRMMSAFDTNEGYELTALGQQFVHYAMNDLTPKIGFHPDMSPASVERSGVRRRTKDSTPP